VKTDESDFLLFQKECWKWINYFGLKNWEWNFTHEENTAFATYWVSVTDRACTINLNTEFDDEGVKMQSGKEAVIKSSAFHEVMEILLAKLGCLVLPSPANPNPQSDVRGATHEIIRIFENTIYKDLKL